MITAILQMRHQGMTRFGELPEVTQRGHPARAPTGMELEAHLGFRAVVLTGCCAASSKFLPLALSSSLDGMPSTFPSGHPLVLQLCSKLLGEDTISSPT